MFSRARCLASSYEHDNALDPNDIGDQVLLKIIFCSNTEELEQMPRANSDVGQSENATNLRGPKSKLDRQFKRFATDETQEHEFLCETNTRALILFSEKQRSAQQENIEQQHQKAKSSFLCWQKIPRRLFANSTYLT